MRHRPQPDPALDATAQSPDPADASTHTERVRHLFDQHNRALVGFIATRLRSQAEARDVAQEAYVRLLCLEKPGAIGFLRAYLFRIANNLALDRLRHRKVRDTHIAPELFEPLLTRPSAERTLLAEQQLATVTAALKELPAKCCEAFVLHHFAELTPREIAERMRLSERMVQKHLARALAHCRARLDEHETTSISTDDRGVP